MLKQQDIQLLKDLLLERIHSNLIKNVDDIDDVKLSRLKSSKESLQRVEETLRQIRETNSDIVIRSHQSNGRVPAAGSMSVARLAYKDIKGSGKHIYAHVSQDMNSSVQYTTGQPILSCDAVLGYEPWIQFEPKERDQLIEQTFIEMVDAWNEKHGK